MAAQTILELAMDNETIPLAKRVEIGMQGKTGKIRTYDHWGSDMDAIQDPTTGFTALMVAAKAGNLLSIEVLVNRGADPNFRTERKGRSALHVAAKYGQIDAVNLLIDLGAQINMTDLAGGTALMHAAKAGYENIVSTLLRRGAGINFTDRCGWAAIHFAAKFGHKPVCEILVAQGAATAIQDSKEGKNPLMLAAQFGRRETLRFFLAQGLDPNITSNIDGITALMLACREGHKGVVVDLIDVGADASAVSGNGWSSLLFAAAAGRRDTSAILLQRGAVNVNFADRRSGGITALTVASRSGQTGVVKLLVDLGATVDSRDTAAGMTPLMHAAKHDAAAAMSLLLAHNADINMRDKKGYTPLMHACIHGSTEAIVELINNFADVNILDKETKSAFDHALLHGHRSLFLSALINVKPVAKVPFLSWLERECPKMSRGTDLGNPSLYLNAFLYGSNGLYAGLYFRNREYDYELISGLVMLAAAFKRSAEADPECAPDMLEKLQHVDEMLHACLQSRAMVADETITNSLLLHKPPIYRTEYDIIELTPALQSGPLALYLDIKLHTFLATDHIRLKIQKLLYSCVRRPPGYKSGMTPTLLGCLSTSRWLRCRYTPIAVIVMNEFPKFLVVVLICGAINSSRTYQCSQLIVLMTVCMVLFEVGLMEDKINGDWPSILLDKTVLMQRRWVNFTNHFNEDIWKRCDCIMYILLILWILDWIANGLQASIPLLALTAIPAAFGLLRVVVALNDAVGMRILMCIDAVSVILQYFVIIAFTALGVGIAMLLLFRHNDGMTGFDSGTITYVSLFETLYGTNHLSDIADTNRHGIGLLILSGFTIWVSTVIFSMIIAELCARVPELEHRNKCYMAYWRAKSLQYNTLVNERSPLCMICAPLNMAPAALYILHYFLLNASKLIPGRMHHLSVAGWVSDIILGMLFLPVAYGTAFFSTLRKSSYSRNVKILLAILSPVVIALNTLILLLTFGWIPAPVYVLTNTVKWSRMNRICYEDRRDCLVKVGLPEVEYQEPEELDLMKQLRRRRQGEEDDENEEAVEGYEGYVDMDERNLHYYGMLLVYTFLRGFNGFSRIYLAVRNVVRGGQPAAAPVGTELRVGAKHGRGTKRAGNTNNNTDNNEDNDSIDSDDDSDPEYDEIGAPIHRNTKRLLDTDNRSINSLPFIGDHKPGAKYIQEDYSQFVIPAYADDAYHFEVPQHLGVLYSLKERQRIFEIVIPEVVHGERTNITLPGMMAPPDKSMVQVLSLSAKDKKKYEEEDAE